MQERKKKKNHTGLHQVRAPRAYFSKATRLLWEDLLLSVTSSTDCHASASSSPRWGLVSHCSRWKRRRSCCGSARGEGGEVGAAPLRAPCRPHAPAVPPRRGQPVGHPFHGVSLWFGEAGLSTGPGSAHGDTYQERGAGQVLLGGRAAVVGGVPPNVAGRVLLGRSRQGWGWGHAGATSPCPTPILVGCGDPDLPGGFADVWGSHRCTTAPQGGHGGDHGVGHHTGLSQLLLSGCGAAVTGAHKIPQRSLSCPRCPSLAQLSSSGSAPSSVAASASLKPPVRPRHSRLLQDPHGFTPYRREVQQGELLGPNPLAAAIFHLSSQVNAEWRSSGHEPRLQYGRPHRCEHGRGAYREWGTSHLDFWGPNPPPFLPGPPRIRSGAGGGCPPWWPRGR